jgi:hypothetical protein
MLEREIRVLARTKYPQTLLLQQIPGVGAITALYFVLKIEDRAIRNCAFPSAGMLTCAGCWSVPRNPFRDRLALKVPCVNMD